MARVLGSLLCALAAVTGCGGGTADPPPPSDARTAAVLEVVDGDTVTLSRAGRSRVIGVDTPEVDGGRECYGREASRFARRVLSPGTEVRYSLGTERRDRYGRALVYVWLADGRFFNAMLVRDGYATPLTVPPNVEHAKLFVRLARAARRAERGLWSPRTCAGAAASPGRA